ncbi:MAG TPA: DUF2948 family protein [Xanthobacteraceae bacterium]|nr:DUF2948 family protein [Xanthobacteraceae bacterium]
MQASLTPLKLIALDRDDLEVLSAHLQDAVINTEDIRWRPSERRLVIGLKRFDWEAVHSPMPEYRRRSAALRFERVLSCKACHIDRTRDTVLNLLAVSFAERDPPAGVVTLTFSGGGAMRLEVECLEAEVADLGAVWATSCCPAHHLDLDLSDPILKQA